MKKETAYVPFNVNLSPIKKMAMIHFHKHPDTEYEALEFHYINGEPYGEGYRVLAWRTDGYRDSYIQQSLNFPEDEQVLTVGGKGLKERHTVEFETVYFDQDDGGLTAGFTFTDKLNRRIVLEVDEKIEQNSKSLTWLPSVGNRIEDPHSLPLFFLYDFDFARKRNTDIHLSIDGEERQVDPFAFPKDFKSRHYVEFSNESVVLSFNPSGRSQLTKVDIDEQGIAQEGDMTYFYEYSNDLHHLKRITVEHEKHPVDITFSPAFPNHKEVMEARPFYGEFEIRPSGEAGTLTGKYNVVYQRGKAVINLSFPDSWNTPKGANYEKIINSVTPNIKSWYKTYHCTQVVELETMSSEVKWKRVTEDNRSSY